MQTKQLNMDEWLRLEANIVAGQPLALDDCACVPVAQLSQSKEAPPLGFIVTHGRDISFVDATSPEAERLLAAWNKAHLQEIESEQEDLPTECWYG